MTWILVAANNGASLFEHTADHGLRRLDDIPGPHPAPAQGLDDPAARREDLEKLRYTLDLAARLEEGVRGGAQALILMAETGLLGAIRRHLSREAAQRIQASLNVAQPDWDEASLGRRLGPLLDSDRSPHRSADFF